MKAMTYDEAHDHYAEVLDSVVDDCEEIVIVRAGREIMAGNPEAWSDRMQAGGVISASPPSRSCAPPPLSANFVGTGTGCCINS